MQQLSLNLNHQKTALLLEHISLACDSPEDPECVYNMRIKMNPKEEISKESIIVKIKKQHIQGNLSQNNITHSFPYQQTSLKFSCNLC